jgi:phospholipid/cholesterol/gamma-HCH transport system substrate-binding protein
MFNIIKSREFIIGLFAAIVVTISFLGYKFLKSESVLSKGVLLTAEYSDVQQLTKTAPVFYKGFEVGNVKDIYINPNDYTKIIITLNIKEPIKIPKDAIAYITTSSIMGGKSVDLIFNQPCSGPDCAINGDKIKGLTKGMLASMVSPEDVDLYMGKFNKGLNNTIDSLSLSLKNPDNEVAKSLKDVQITLANLRNSTALLNGILVSSSGNINQMMKNLNGITSNLNASNASISHVMSNTDTFTSNLKSINFSNTVNNTDSALIALKHTLQTSESTILELNALLAKVKNGEGAIGKFLSDKEFAKSLEVTIKQVELLTQDFRLNPRRYVNFNIFKWYKKYKLPEEDPAKPLIDSIKLKN